jgi:hypothetical protein
MDGLFSAVFLNRRERGGHEAIGDAASDDEQIAQRGPPPDYARVGTTKRDGRMTDKEAERCLIFIFSIRFVGNDVWG